LGSLEVRWPTFLIDDFWFAAFTDIGAIAPEWGVFGEDDIFPSVGGGLRWLVTGQIPLRLDIGVPLRDTGLSVREARYHLNIFYQL
jgi:outer membrane translocation and assembly module TamA